MNEDTSNDGFPATRSETELPAPPLDTSSPASVVQRRPPRRTLVIAAVALVVGIVAVVTVTQLGEDEGAAAPSPTASVSPSPSPEVPAPIDLEAKATADSVTLTWAPPPGVDATGYRILRDGTPIKVLPGGKRRWVDDRVMPITRYEYDVVAVDGNDALSVPATVRVKTGTPKIQEARLEGVFDLDLRRTSTYGISDEPERSTAGWRFRPDCHAGACDVVWKDIVRPIEAIDLARDGARYEGSGSGRIGFECGTTPLISSYRISVKVIDARVADGVWTATKIEGTWSYSSSEQLGCRSGGTTWSAVGKLVV